jgi:enoyl-CoA hydratase/carnithine racemase
MPDHVLSAFADGVLTVTLNRPDQLNAFTGEMLQGLLDAMDMADADSQVRAVVLTGAGERAFCAGADLSSGGFEREDEQGPHRDGGGLVTLRMFELTKPLIVAFNGVAVGVGASMSLAADIRLASTTARFGFVYARRGIVPEGNSSWFLPRIVGISRALEWVCTGRIFPAQEAFEAGLVRSLHAPNDLLAAAQALGREIAENTSALSVALSRQMMWRLLGADHPMAAHEVESAILAGNDANADVREGVASFLEKRPPAFPLRVPGDLPAVFPWWSERIFRPLQAGEPR